MDHFELPPELQPLETELAARDRTAPSADLRRRALDGLSPELLHEGTRARWALAVAAAAAVLVWINLSLSASQATDYRSYVDVNGASAAATAEQIQSVLPELSRREAHRQAVLLRAGSHLIPCPIASQHPELQSRLRRASGGLK
jgi:hypothetical protein